MSFRFLKRTPVSGVEWYTGDDPDLVVDSKLPGLGLTNFRGTLRKGDIVSVVIESTTPIVALFDVGTGHFSSEGYDRRWELHQQGRYYPSEEHFFRATSDPHHNQHKTIAVEPLFLTEDQGVIHNRVDEDFYRDVDIPVDMCDSEDVLMELVSTSRSPPARYGFTESEVRRKLAEIHEPTHWFMTSFKRNGRLLSAIEMNRVLRSRTEASADDGGSLVRVAPQGNDATARLAALKVELRKWLVYVDYRETIDLRMSSRSHRAYVEFIHAHPHELARCLDLDEEAGELDAVLAWTGTVEEIEHRHTVDYPRIVRHIFGDGPVKCHCRLSLCLPAFVGPPSLPLEVTKLHRSHVYRVFRTDPIHSFILPGHIVDWGQNNVDDCVLSMLSPGCVVRVQVSHQNGSQCSLYCQLLQALDSDHFLAVTLDIYAPVYLKAVLVVNKRVITEVPFSFDGNVGIRRAYRAFLRETLRAKEAAQGLPDDAPKVTDALDPVSDLDNDDEMGDDLMGIELEVLERPDAETTIPVTYDPLVALWNGDQNSL